MQLYGRENPKTKLHDSCRGPHTLTSLIGFQRWIGFCIMCGRSYIADRSTCAGEWNPSGTFHLNGGGDPRSLFTLADRSFGIYNNAFKRRAWRASACVSWHTIGSLAYPVTVSECSVRPLTYPHKEGLFSVQIWSCLVWYVHYIYKYIYLYIYIYIYILSFWNAILWSYTANESTCPGEWNPSGAFHLKGDGVLWDL